MRKLLLLWRLFCQGFILIWGRIDTEKAKEDARKIGLALIIGGLIGLAIKGVDLSSCFAALAVGAVIWYSGGQK